VSGRCIRRQLYQMLANENESGHRLSVNDDRKPQSYIDMKNELPMAVDATNDALRVISMYTPLCCRAIQKPHSDRSVLGKIQRNVFARADHPCPEMQTRCILLWTSLHGSIVDFATEYANALWVALVTLPLLFRTIIRWELYLRRIIGVTLSPSPTNNQYTKLW
jgi:hypothetical protein